ncbi:FtsX-like permease family protein [Sphaerisporangium fuscum]|uniref:FtsX-like permease family protein n=1 Tax=Sphaerisporangium fuscum TaxID=2835868 RepID=UPI001BDDBB26|nr:FtsX-like permease family protein [Sphaerisporangium fuscum]
MSGLTGLTWRLLKGGGRRGLLGSSLMVAAVAVSTALLLFAVAVNFAFAGRADRGAWRNPVQATGTARAIEAFRTEFIGDRALTVVDVAVLEPGVAPPKGLPRLPGPGEVLMSPALAELAKGSSLGARFPGEPAGTIGDEALVYPGELVAVVGHAPGDTAVKAKWKGDYRLGTSATKVADLTGAHSNDADAYRILALIASVLMVVPLLVFGGAAARLTVARRDQRLASLRLVGATPGQVVAMTVAEAVITAFGGAVLGLVLYAVAIPPLSHVRMAGGEWFASDMWPGVLPIAAVLLAVPLLVGLSAVVGLRRVVVSPLGVARRETPPAMRFVRLIALLAVLAAVPVMGVAKSIALVVAILTLAFLALNLVGPWVVGLIGRLTARTAKRPARLLAGRRLVDDPKSAWRTVSGVALTGFVAGFIGLLTPPADLDVGADRATAWLLQDIRTGTIVVLVVSFLVAIVSAGITAASSVLDRRQNYALLRLAGTPLEVLDKARRLETLIPLTVMGGGSIATGVLCGTPFIAFGVNTTGVLILASCVVAGFAGVVGAGAMSKPLLRSVTADPAPRPD